MFFAQTQDLKPQAFRNAYDIPRRSLLDQLTRMRTNLLKTHKFILGQDEGKDSHGVLGMQGVAFYVCLQVIQAALVASFPNPRSRVEDGRPRLLAKEVLYLGAQACSWE